MAWYNSTGKENHPSLYETRVVTDAFSVGQKEIKTTMTIYFQNSKLIRDQLQELLSANAKQAKAT